MNERSYAITPRRQEDYPQWYQEVVKAADLAQNAPVRGCMVIKPWGYGIWENIQKELDVRFKATGHKNAYFPLLIPLRFLEKEAKHVEGFAKECAVVTHARLEVNEHGRLVPADPLEEPLIVRPTSETIIGEMFSLWVQSYRDLPILINQWANVVRWELRPRLFLRTAEFLWQEGHTVHATQAEAQQHARKMLDVYTDFCRNFLALPVIPGRKPPTERFPGADDTLTIEAMMQDRKALQAGTSHFLGQHFSKASNIQFLDAQGQQQYAWGTSWGMTTRLIGALVMTHADDDGMVLPPRIAPAQVVILPIIPKAADAPAVMEACQALKLRLEALSYAGRPLGVELDARDLRSGPKTWEWIKKGIPIRIEIGPKDLEAGVVSLYRRDQEPKARQTLSTDALVGTLLDLLDAMQAGLLEKAQALRDTHTVEIDDLAALYAFFSSDTQIHGGFAAIHWNGDPAHWDRLAQDLKVSPRCFPFDRSYEPGKCIFTGEFSAERMIVARAY